MKLVYTAGKYRGGTIWGTRQNIRLAELVMGDLVCMGLSVICPHKNTALMDGIVSPNDHEVWLAIDLEMLKRCDAIVMLPNWINSEGAKAELEKAKEWGLDVFFYPRDIKKLMRYAIQE